MVAISKIQLRLRQISRSSWFAVPDPTAGMSTRLAAPRGESLYTTIPCSLMENGIHGAMMSSHEGARWSSCQVQDPPANARPRLIYKVIWSGACSWSLMHEIVSFPAKFIVYRSATAVHGCVDLDSERPSCRQASCIRFLDNDTHLAIPLR